MTTPISLTTLPPDGGTTAVALAGELDLDTAERIEPALTGLAGGARGDLLLDLADLTFCDSSGAALLVRVHRRCAAAGVRLRVSRLRGTPAHVIRVLGVHRTVSCTFA
jgi:anti-anti-sigma factor